MFYLYIILFLIIIYLLICAYVKIKFRFWSLQPVFHIYDFIYWINPPGIINNDLPEINKYINFLNITTQNIQETKEIILTQMCNFINCHYLRSKNAEYTPSTKNILEYLKNTNHPSYLSIYKEPKILFQNGNPEITINDYKAVITARPLYITFKNKKTFPTYYVDNLCVNPLYRKKGIAQQIIQTHYHNLRHFNKNIKTCLFKREGNMTAIVPLTTYITIGYELIDSNNDKFLDSSYSVIEITSKNLHLFASFIQLNIKKFNCSILPDLSNINTLIKSNNIFIYSIINNNNIIAVYAFRNPSLKYDKIHNSIECFATISNCNNNIFITGFNISLQLCNKYINATRLLLENTSDSYNIIERYEKLNIPIFSKSPTAFFMYNYACYSIHPNKCLFIY